MGLLDHKPHLGNGVLGRDHRLLAHNSRDRIQNIVIQVRSLAQAKTFLRKKNLLGVTSSTEIFIHPSGIQGLRIALVE
jgi:hypothetical protein